MRELDAKECKPDCCYAPLLHLRRGDIDTLRLATTAHRKVDIEVGETKTLVALGDDVSMVLHGCHGIKADLVEEMAERLDDSNVSRILTVTIPS